MEAIKREAKACKPWPLVWSFLGGINWITKRIGLRDRLIDGTGMYLVNSFGFFFLLKSPSLHLVTQGSFFTAYSFVIIEFTCVVALILFYLCRVWFIVTHDGGVLFKMSQHTLELIPLRHGDLFASSFFSSVFNPVAALLSPNLRHILRPGCINSFILERTRLAGHQFTSAHLGRLTWAIWR